MIAALQTRGCHSQETWVAKQSYVYCQLGIALPGLVLQVDARYYLASLVMLLDVA
jgi:hypothetical protein